MFNYLGKLSGWVMKLEKYCTVISHDGYMFSKFNFLKRIVMILEPCCIMILYVIKNGFVPICQ